MPGGLGTWSLLRLSAHFVERERKPVGAIAASLCDMPAQLANKSFRAYMFSEPAVICQNMFLTTEAFGFRRMDALRISVARGLQSAELYDGCSGRPADPC
jgi:hypothetical protein